MHPIVYQCVAIFTYQEVIYTVKYQLEVLPEAFDSHFHLDRSLDRFGLPAQTGLPELIASAKPANDRVRLVGTVANYCDPDTYPSERNLDDTPDDLLIAIGIHPRKAAYRTPRLNDAVRRLKDLVRHQKVVAVGEIGLDHTEPMKYWHLQVELILQVLSAVEPRHVLVLHCRGMDGDCGTEAYLLLLNVLKKHITADQPLHLHCFTGNQYVLSRWLEVFPRTFFGFTRLATRFNADQITALKEIDESRLLIETDAPYFPPTGERYSTPGNVAEAAKAECVNGAGAGGDSGQCAAPLQRLKPVEHPGGGTAFCCAISGEGELFAENRLTACCGDNTAFSLHTYEIKKQWDGRPSVGTTKISLVRGDNDLEIHVAAPFYNDPPAPSGPSGQPFPQLWDYEVVEAFFLSDSGKYLEVELCPHGQHLVLLLNGRRNIIKDQLPIQYKSEINDNEWTGVAKIPLEYFPAKVTKFNLYAIHGTGGGEKDYEAFSPVPGEQPDFHRLEYFADMSFDSLVPENYAVSYSSSVWSP